MTLRKQISTAAGIPQKRPEAIFSQPVARSITVATQFQSDLELLICKDGACHPSHNLAKLPFEPSVVIAREAIRSRYGDGFAGAPLKLNRLPADGRTTHRDADGAAHAGSTGTHGPGPVRSDPAE